MQIEAGKYYRTRDGRKVGPLFQNVDNDFLPWQNMPVGGEGEYRASMAWGSDGSGCRVTPFSECDSGLDLIAEWEDPATLPAFLDTDRAKTIATALDALRKANDAALDAKAFAASRAIIEAMEAVHKLMLEADE